MRLTSRRRTRSAACRPSAVARRVDRRHRRSQHADAALGRRHRDPISRTQVETLAPTSARPRQAYFPFRDRRMASSTSSVPSRARRCPDDGCSAATPTPARTCVRRDGVRHRHVRGRACAGDAVLLLKKAKSMLVGSTVGCHGRHGEGHRARGDRQDRTAAAPVMRSSSPGAPSSRCRWRPG